MLQRDHFNTVSSSNTFVFQEIFLTLSVNILSCWFGEVHIVDTPKILSFKCAWKFYSPDIMGKWKTYSPYKICLCILDFGTCHNLIKVEFMKARIYDKFYFKLIPKHHFKELILHCYEYLNKIKISSSTLKIRSIVRCDLLVQVIFMFPSFSL